MVVIRSSSSGAAWDLTRETREKTGEDLEKLRWYALCLFAASAAETDFNGSGTYVNSTHFTLVGQAYSEPATHITIVARRRDGQVKTGGYEHRKVRVSMPPQCHAPRPVKPDLKLLQALLAAETTPLGRKLSGALPYFGLAWTDMDAMLNRTELLLSASTIEQLLGPVQGRVEFGKEVAKLLQPWQEVTVKDALATRPRIKLHPQVPTHNGGLKGATEAEQQTWFVHRKWAEDLYEARNAAVHHGARTNNGWSTHEHLVASAIIFPLLLKLVLVPSGAYQLSQRDVLWLTALDKSLALPRWWDAHGRPQFANELVHAQWAIANRGAEAFLRASFAKQPRAGKAARKR